MEELKLPVVLPKTEILHGCSNVKILFKEG
jgi:hypothetical protein